MFYFTNSRVKWYGNVISMALNKEIDWVNGNIKACLLDGFYEFDASGNVSKDNVGQDKNKYLYDIDINRFVKDTNWKYIETPLTNKKTIYDSANKKIVFRADDIRFDSISPYTNSIRHLIIYQDTGNIKTSPLIACINLGANRSFDSGLFIIKWNFELSITIG